MFVNDTTQGECESFIANWQADGLGTKEAFVHFNELLMKNDHALISFHARPGITCSLRAHIAPGQGGAGPLYVMVDVIDDDPAERWLSVCFYGERITDPEQRGDFVPGGLLGQDAVCFDYDGDNPELLSYIAKRIIESYDASLAVASS